ncbi:molybdopterin-dependent oxidoreductase [Streptomyces flavofungini]|uniref:Molybdopterin-dependent oxidoreductase n=1 Tax=Streptomyces flavofungini TaxID=68200 RepID=A0ABS0XB43_9ACTN|nr:molybdopterin-dependent oxidoreductase [Streptomyces flavofungini]MBJ3810369.1 molybdopterin-dependent oxidoreductase [Streptomyces flavofungini]MBJ3811993.1 molybdopterin-dependent oxidoreductase [Streptomyces flavofungini]GHC51252.1 oxidoreductase [Streptomyces flavofungini]
MPLRRLDGWRVLAGAVSGLLAGFAALASAELVSAAVRPEAGPVVAVGGAAIDRTPASVKDWAIQQFGTDDKLVLQIGILAVLALLAGVLGVVALRRRLVGAAGVLLFGVIGALAATGRPDSTALSDALPSLTGSVVGAGLLYGLGGRLATTSPWAVDRASAPPTSGDVPGPDKHTPAGWDRRGFVIAATVAAAASTGVGALGKSFNASRGRAAVASREGVELPSPASPARAVPAGARVRVPGVSSFITSNKDFYRVDTALVVPKVNAGTWRLRIHGTGVTRETRLSFADLLGRELIERDITLTCVSNEVGGPYVGNARWIGVRLADLLTEHGVVPPSRGGPADQLVARSVEGMTIGTPVDDVMDGRDAMLALGMNGRPLPFAHGFPVRMLVPGLYGYVSACKWIEDIELTTFDDYDPYWVKRDWAREAPVKTQSRIDTPKPFARPKAGTVMVAGVAWAQHRGIDKVEVRVDDGPWRPADLAAEDTRDTWRQWSFPWPATPGGHTLTVRATDRTGAVQTARRTRTIPDGASGRHSVVVTVD